MLQQILTWLMNAGRFCASSLMVTGKNQHLKPVPACRDILETFIWEVRFPHCQISETVLVMCKHYYLNQKRYQKTSTLSVFSQGRMISVLPTWPGSQFFKNPPLVSEGKNLRLNCLIIPAINQNASISVLISSSEILLAKVSPGHLQVWKPNGVAELNLTFISKVRRYHILAA